MSYPLFKVHMPVDEATHAVREVLASGFVNEGLQVSQFQKEISAWLGVDKLVLTNSCTSALTIAYHLCGVESGTDVVTTAMTCIASNTPIINLGGNIIWADIDRLSGGIDPADIEAKITPETKCIVSVAWAGTPDHLEAIDALAKKHGIFHVQDAAHALGAQWNGDSISDFADFTCYSFQAIKHLSCGDGGALVCRDEEQFKLARKLKWFGYDRDEHKDEKGEWKGQRWQADVLPGEVGFKFNMNNISAAIGLSQMAHIDEILASHRYNASIYTEVFKKIDGILPCPVPKEATSSHWVYTAIIEDESVDRDAILEQLNQEGIMAGQVHLPNDLYTAFKGSACDLPNTRYFSNRQISMPCGWWITEKDVRMMTNRVRELLG